MNKSTNSLMKKKDKEMLESLNQKIRSEYRDFRGSYFFGSRVNGNFRPNSDYDIVLLFDKIEREKELEICGIIGELEYKYDIFIDMKILTKEEFEYNPFFYEEVTTKGIFYGSG